MCQLLTKTTQLFNKIYKLLILKEHKLVWVHVTHRKHSTTGNSD